MSNITSQYKLFSVYGIEIEYMIVDKQSLMPLFITDQVLQQLNNGELTNEVEVGNIAISNELALHVIELKTNGPAAELNNLDEAFLNAIHLVQSILDKHNAILLPTGMHPWYVPDASLKLWPHSNTEIYSAYNKIFNCQGHGWGNLQSTHINLPFANENEFIVLHEAIRLLLPLIPALTASTPFVANKPTDTVDNRLLYYGKNQAMLPCISGKIIPESVSSYQEYQEKILQKMYSAIAPYDKEGILQHEWLNSRGAITRFERNAIEIRIVDSQESPLMDISCVILIVNALKNILINQLPIKNASFSTEELASIYQSCIDQGSNALIRNTHYLELFGIAPNESEEYSARKVWQQIYTKIKHLIPEKYHTHINILLNRGNLAERLLNKYHENKEIDNIYHKLHNCLLNNQTFF